MNIDVKNLLVEGENTIHLVFKSPVEYVLSKQNERPLQNVGEAVEGISHLRKAHCMFGWDWGPKLPDMGIWRNISIRGYNNGRIDDIYITQKHETSKVQLDVRVRLVKWSSNEFNILVRIKDPKGKILENRLISTVSEEHVYVDIENPELWWPNTFGEQPLYNVEVYLLETDTLLDSKSLKIGLRTLTVRRKRISGENPSSLI